MIADLSLTVDGHRASYREVRALADELCDGKIIAVGGGGYELTRVVPRSWTHLIATMLDRDVPPDTETPEEWRDLAAEVANPSKVPTTMSDGGDTSFSPWELGPGAAVAMADDRSMARLDQAILDTRRAAFPPLGLDPDDPRD